MRTSAICVVLILAACSSENGSPGSRTLPTTVTTPGGIAAGSGANLGSAGLDTDSPSTIVNVTPLPTGPEGSPVDPGACEVGKFCGPQGPDPDHCGTLRLEQDVEITRNPGNLLIGFDQSVSMQEPWGATGGSKLQAAQAAVMTAVSSLQDSLTVGAIFFPTSACAAGPGGLGGLPGGGLPGGGLPSGGLPGLGGGVPAVQPIDGSGQIPFQPGAQFLTAWAAHWNAQAAALNIGTPMQEAFDRADSAIQSTMLKGLLAVVAFTDGQPNCFPAGGMTETEPTRAASWLMNKQIKTYVVGLPGA